MTIIEKYEQILKNQSAPTCAASAIIPYEELRELLNLARIGEAQLINKRDCENCKYESIEANEMPCDQCLESIGLPLWKAKFN